MPHCAASLVKKALQENVYTQNRWHKEQVRVPEPIQQCPSAAAYFVVSSPAAIGAMSSLGIIIMAMSSDPENKNFNVSAVHVLRSRQDEVHFLV